MEKICYVVTTPLTIESFFIPQLKNLSENGLDVSVVCCDDNRISNELGDNIHFIGCDIPRGISIKGSFKAIKKLITIFKKEKFNLIQYSTPNAAFYASIAARSVGCKVRNYHLMGYRYLGASGIGKIVLKIIEKFTCALSTNIECVSKSNLELGVQEKIFKRKKAYVVWNGSSGGVDLNKFDINKKEIWRKELRQELGYKDDDFIFGFVGRITRDKGINELLEAFFKLDNDSKLFVIGSNENDGTVNPILWEKAMNSSKVMIYSPTYNIEKYYAMINILVLPSYREGFGNVVIEAAAMGTPSIVSNIPGPIDAVIINKTGIVIKPKSVDDLVYAMKNAQKIDVSEMGREAEKFSKCFFGSDLLCKKIFERKIELLEKSFEK